MKSFSNYLFKFLYCSNKGDVFICKLRDKLTSKSKNKEGKKYISTVWGQGYLLRDPNEEF